MTDYWLLSRMVYGAEDFKIKNKMTERKYNIRADVDVKICSTSKKKR